VAADVAFEPGDARDLDPAGPEGTLCFNPPYGERLAARHLQLGGLYRGLAAMLRRHGGWTAVILSGSPLLERAIALRPEVTHRLWNGPLEVRLLRYRIPGAP
jgi:putative N6-adenine-specific DNA methylase